jgi:hypothetical protein
MEGCHWPFRKADPSNYQNLLKLLLSGKSVVAGNETPRWLVDYAGPMGSALKNAWLAVTGGDHGLPLRQLQKDTLHLPKDVSGLPPADNPLMETARKAILDCIRASCGVSLAQALE